MNSLKIVFLISVICCINATVVTVNGGQLQVCGAVTGTQIDLMVNYTADVKWLAMIFSPDQVNADAHLFIVDSNNAANPVKVRDAYLDQTSGIVFDDVNNIQPSIKAFSGDISYGLKVAYNRDLNTGDTTDIRFYPNQVIQVCFISSTIDFVGGGFQEGNQKVCTFFSLHQALDYYDQRLLGNFGATTLLGGSNMTLYITQSTDGWDVAPWLYVSFVFKQQGLNPFSAKWIGITYRDSLVDADMGMIQYATRDFKLKVHIHDSFITNASYAKDDFDYVIGQGGDDLLRLSGALQSSSYLVASYKRKFSTGDTNRDTIIQSSENVFCIILGNNLQYTNFVQTERVCLPFVLNTPYSSNFRVVQDSDGNTVNEYVPPVSTVRVVKWENNVTFSLFFLFLTLLYQ